LIYRLLRTKQPEVFLAGNIPNKATLPLLGRVQRSSLVVLELSSWQLQGLDWEKVSPSFALITNIYPDHLNRYRDMEEYTEDKKLIFKHQGRGEFLLLNSEVPVFSSFAREAVSQVVWFSKRDFPLQWRLRLLGSHNRENAAAALKLGELFSLDREKMRAVFEQFEGVAGRLEKIGEGGGIAFINDTTSTTPIAGICALRAVKEPLVLIAGGASKNLDLADFAREIVRRAEGVVLLKGTATPNLAELIKKEGGEKKILGTFDSMRKAVLTAQRAVGPGGAVLLSPGCASFGLFKNEFDRGSQFNEVVRDLTAKPSFQ
jgi:UDP-N-acetylmuramoylalanine--D-glutamate ligase